jgi:hypothetical protein
MLKTNVCVNAVARMASLLFMLLLCEHKRLALMDFHCISFLILPRAALSEVIFFFFSLLIFVNDFAKVVFLMYSLIHYDNLCLCQVNQSIKCL